MTNIEKYNKLIKDIDKAEIFIIKNQKDPKIFDYLAKFMQAMNKSQELIKAIEQELGRKLTSEEITGGVYD